MVSTRAKARASPSSPWPVSSEARGGSQGRKHPGSGKSNLPDSTPLAQKLIRLQNGASWSPLNTRMEPTALSENDAMISISNSVKVPGRLLGPDSSVSTACRRPASKLSRHILRRPRATGRGCGPASHRTAAVGRRHGHSEARGSAGGRTWASPTGTVQERSMGSHGGFLSSRPEAWRGVSEVLTRAGLARRGRPQTCRFPDWTLRHQWWGLTRCRPRGGDHVPDAVCTWQSPPHAPGGRQRHSQAGLLRGGTAQHCCTHPARRKWPRRPGSPRDPRDRGSVKSGNQIFTFEIPSATPQICIHVIISI